MKNRNVIYNFFTQTGSAAFGKGLQLVSVSVYAETE